MSMSACASSAGFGETERTFCRELLRERPTYAPQDTEETKEQGVRFLTLLTTLCKEQGS